MSRIRCNNFVQLKRFFRDNNVPYSILTGCSSLIVPLPEPYEFPSILFRFNNDYPNEVVACKLPMDGFEFKFEAVGLYQILNQLIRFKLLDGRKLEKLKIRGVNYFPGQVIDPRMKVSKRRKSA